MFDYPLSPIDYVFTGPGSQPITFAYYYPRQLDAALLKKGLEETLEYFPLLKSRLVRDSERTFSFHHSDEGLSFKTRDADLDITRDRDITRYIEPVLSAPGQPLTRIVLLRLPRGSVLAVSVSHALVDGFSYFHFLSSWARLCRGQRILKPALEREGIWPDFIPSQKPITAEDVYLKCGLFFCNQRSPLSGQKMSKDRIFFSGDSIRDHLDRARGKNPDIQLTKNDVISALLWKKYLPHWVQGNDNSRTHLTCPFDFRRILKNIPTTYFGCAICFTTVTLPFNRVQEATVSELAVEVRRAIRKVKEDYVLQFMQTLDNLRCQKGIPATEAIHLRHPLKGLIVTNLTRMPVRDLDFGSGPLTDFLAYVDVLRGAAILQAEDGVDVLVSYPPAVDDGIRRPE